MTDDDRVSDALDRLTDRVSRLRESCLVYEQRAKSAEAALAEAHRTLADVEAAIISVIEDRDDYHSLAQRLRQITDALAASRSGAESAGEQR